MVKLKFVLFLICVISFISCDEVELKEEVKGDSYQASSGLDEKSKFF